MRKKTYIFVSLFLIVGILIESMFFLVDRNESAHFVDFADSKSLNNESREELINRLESNDISFQIDENGNVKINEKDVRKAVVCCS